MSSLDDLVDPAQPPTVARIAELLSVTYDESGVAIWLTSLNKHLGGAWPILRCRTADGRREVLAVAETLEGGGG